ncbi:MAG: maleylpyruvate isomerase N-terminal domain-containing protein [Geodermatophilaceae bacterium]|nr:maleylpyruvate isomerase N-terminal domain-containing protein [Geodermatophilaceae bacterium]
MTDNATDPRRAIDQVDRLIVAAPPNALANSTPCEEYDVGALIDHLVVIADRVIAAAAPRPAPRMLIGHAEHASQLHRRRSCAASGSLSDTPRVSCGRGSVNSSV